MEKVLVMGGSYFIGKKVVEALVTLGEYEVYVLNRGTKLEGEKKYRQIFADRNQLEQMMHALSNFEFDYIVDISCLHKDQVDILMRVINRNKLKRIIFLSSSAVYKQESVNGIKRENDVIGYNKYWQEYGLNKIAAEKAYEKYSNLFGISCNIIRPPYVYGEWNYARRESFIFDHLIKKYPIIIPINNNRIQFIYVNDLAEIVLKLLSSNSQNCVNIYNVGNRRYITMLEWVILCGYVIGISPQIYFYQGQIINSKEYFPFHDYDNVLDVKKINDTIYYKETPMHTGLDNALEWFYKYRDTINFDDKIFRNESNLLLNERSELIKIQR